MKKYIRKINKFNISIIEIKKRTKKNNIIFYSVLKHNKRAIDYGKIGKLTLEQANIALKYFNYRCAFSGEKFIKFDNITNTKKICNLSLEHTIALVTGGNSLAYNCVPSVLQYNLRKSVLHPLDWWKAQRDINNNKIFNEIRLLKLINYTMKSLKAFDEEIEKYEKIIMTPNKIDKYIIQNYDKLISNVKTAYKVIENKAILEEVPHNIKIPRTSERKLKYKQIKLDIFISDCINLLEEYDIPNDIIKYLRKYFKELKEIDKVFEKIPKQEKIQKELIKFLKSKNIENVYTVASTVKLKEIQNKEIDVSRYIEQKLKKVFETLKENKISTNNINIILDIYPMIIEDENEQKIIIKMIENYKKIKNKNMKEYLLKIENRVKAEDEILVENIINNTKKDIEYLNKEEFDKLKKKLKYNALYNRKNGRRLKNAYEKLYSQFKKRNIKEPELTKETSKAFIYSRIGIEGFNALQENNKYAEEISEKIIRNYKKGITKLDFYLLEDKKNKSVKEADKELTEEILLRLNPYLKNLQPEELKILKRRLSSNSKTCIKSGIRLIKVYNRIYYIMKKQGLKEPDLNIEASKAYIYSKICQVGFFSIKCNDIKYRDKNLNKIINNYNKEFEDIGYFLLDSKTNVSIKQADIDLTNLVLEKTKEITKDLNKEEKIELKKQLLSNYNYDGHKGRKLIVGYNKIYYELKKKGLIEPELSVEASKAYLYAKIATVGFSNIVQKERNAAKNNIKRVLSQYKEGLEELDYYLLRNKSKNIKDSDKKLTEKVLLNSKEIINNLSQEEKEQLKKLLIKNTKYDGEKGIKLINAYNKIYYELKKRGLKEPILSIEASKAYIYAKIGNIGFSYLIINNMKYTNNNLKKLLKEYKEEIENIGYYLLDNKQNKNVIEADIELTNHVFINIKEITQKLSEDELDILKNKLSSNAVSNIEKGMRLVNVYNRIYYELKKQGLKEPELSIEASKAYLFSKIFNVGFYNILKGREKQKYVNIVLNNYKANLKDISYYLLENKTEKKVEDDDKKLTEYILQNVQDIVNKLSVKDKEKLKTELLHNAKSNLQDGIRQRNAYNRIYYKLKKEGIEEPKLTKEVCKAYIYAKISPISFKTIVTYNKKGRKLI